MSTITNNNLRLDIQGLRAIAVLAVMLFHGNNNILPAGFIGVDIFFVISGFIVTHSIINKDQPFSITHFIQARTKRIIPAYAILLIITTLIAILLFTPNDFQFFVESLKSASYFTSNSYFNNVGDYFAPSSHEQPLLHTWSLSIEMQFYLLLSFMFLLPKKLWKYITFTLFIISVAFLFYQEYQLGQYQYYSLLSRTPEFLLGVVLALITYYSHPPQIKQTFLNVLSFISIIILI